MNRETAKKISVLKKSMDAMVKEIAKPFKYKVIDGHIWTIQNKFIFTFLPYIATPSTGVTFGIKCGAKPIYVDDLLWDVLGIPENKEAKLSLHVNGAFSLFSVPFQHNIYDLIELTSEDVYSKLQTELSNFNSFLCSIQGMEAEWFTEMEAAKESYYHSELMRLMMRLHYGNFKEVLQYAQTHNVTGFVIGNEEIGESLKKYCLERL